MAVEQRIADNANHRIKIHRFFTHHIFSAANTDLKIYCYKRVIHASDDY